MDVRFRPPNYSSATSINHPDPPEDLWMFIQTPLLPRDNHGLVWTIINVTHGAFPACLPGVRPAACAAMLLSTVRCACFLMLVFAERAVCRAPFIATACLLGAMGAARTQLGERESRTATAST